MTSQTKLLVDLTRPYNSLTPFLAFNIGYFFLGPGTTGWNYFIGVICVLLVHSFATVQNDIEDLEIDKVNAPNKGLSSGKITLEDANRFKNGLLVPALILGLTNFPAHLFFVLAMIFLSWAYNMKPLVFSRKPIISIIILAVMYSTLPLTYGYSLTGTGISPFFILMAAAWFLLRFSISMLKDLKDEAGDKLFGKITFSLKFGKAAAIMASIALAIISYSAIIGLSYFHKPNWLLVAAALIALYEIYLRYKLLRTRNPDDTRISFNKIFFGQNYFDLLYLLWLLA